MLNMAFNNFLGVGGQAGAVQRCPTCRGTGMQVAISSARHSDTLFFKSWL